MRIRHRRLFFFSVRGTSHDRFAQVLDPRRCPMRSSSVCDEVATNAFIARGTPRTPSLLFRLGSGDQHLARAHARFRVAGAALSPTLPLRFVNAPPPGRPRANGEGIGVIPDPRSRRRGSRRLNARAPEVQTFFLFTDEVKHTPWS